MRYAILHCRNPLCARHIWVPENNLGRRGKCPECGKVMKTLAEIPDDQLVEGPNIMQEFDVREEALAGVGI